MTIKDKVLDKIHEIEDASDKMLVPEHEHTAGEALKHDVDVVKEKIKEIEDATDKILVTDKKPHILDEIEKAIDEKVHEIEDATDRMIYHDKK